LVIGYWLLSPPEKVKIDDFFLLVTH